MGAVLSRRWSPPGAMTQSEAKKFCEEEQKVPSHIFRIDSAEENSAIVAEIKPRVGPFPVSYDTSKI